MVPQPDNLKRLGITMKVFENWEIIQPFVESGEAPGQICLDCQQKLATNTMIYIFICTWHITKIIIINVKMRLK
jgi:hypothetical protein